MLKVFISHSTNEDSFVTWLWVKLEKDFPQWDIFVDHKSSKVGDEGHIFLRKVEESHFFIPICSKEYSQRDNCKEELRHALKSRKSGNNKLPNIFPLRFKCPDDLLPDELRIKLDSTGNSKGFKWENFSNEKEWDDRYWNLQKALSEEALDLRLDTEENFYADAKHIELILKRAQPTSCEIKLMIDIFLKQEEYSRYFFTKLESPEWLKRLNVYGFFKRNPLPIESEQQAGFYHIPYWPVLDYLEKISQECSEPQNEKYAQELIQIIRDVTNYRDESGKIVDNFRTWWAFAKILANLPSAVITLEDIDLISIWGDSGFEKHFLSDIGQKLLPKFIESDNPKDNQKALRIVEIVNSKEFEERKGMDSYYLEKIYSKKNCQLLGKRCGYTLVEILIEKILNIIPKEEKDNYSYLWQPAIEDHPRNRAHNDPPNVFLNALRDTLISYLSSEDDASGKENNLRILLAHDLNSIKRIAIFAVNKNWDQYKNLFWNFIQKDHFDEINLRHEIYMLLQENFKKFDKEEKQKTIGLIEDCLRVILQEATEEREEERCKYGAYWKQCWFSAMVSQGDQRLDDLYYESKKITQTDPEHPEFSSYISITDIKPPLTPEELLGKTVPDIVCYLDEFTSKEEWGKPTEADLALVLRQAVTEDPGKFEAELDKFLNVKLLYIARMIAGFEESWKSKSYIFMNWGRILSFCRDIVINPRFWEAKEGGDKYVYTDQDRVVDAISSLIEEGTRSDEWAFDPDYLPLAEEILLKLNENQASRMNEKKEIRNAVNTALNTAKGHIVRALVNYALRVARVEKKSGIVKDIKWSDSVKNEFDKELRKSSEERSLEFSTFMGEYLPQLHYLDKSWVAENINRIFSQDHSTHWNVAIQGYLWSNPYKHIYTLLRENSHYEKAINTKFEDGKIRKRLVQHICLGYLWGGESLENSESLFNMLLTKWACNEIQEIIDFFWMHRDADIGDDILKRIIDFWRFCYEKLKKLEDQEQLTSEDKRIISNLSSLIAFLTDISEENKNWLLFIAPYVNENHQPGFFIEYLNKLADKNPEVVGEIYWKMIEGIKPHEPLPSYKEEDITAIVKKLYKTDRKVLAGNICKKYARWLAGTGNDFLWSICNKNNL